MSPQENDNLRETEMMIYFSKEMNFLAIFASIIVFCPGAGRADGASVTGSQLSGTQLACGRGPGRQTQIFGNYFKIVNNGVFIYDDSTKAVADALVPESISARGSDNSLKMPKGNISDITYVKYSQSMGGWVNCPLDFVKNISS